MVCVDPNAPNTLVTPGMRNLAITNLGRRLNAHYAGTLLVKPDQGKVFEVTRRDGVSNHFLRTGGCTRFCDWRFIHRARLGVLPLNAIKRWQQG